MANIFYDTGGSFSALTPKKLVYANLTSLGVNAAYSATSLAAPGKECAFTASEAGDVDGIFTELRIDTVTAAQSVTVTLQEYVGATWTDRVSKTLTYSEIVGVLAATLTGKGVAACWVYFQFAAPYTITTAANTWRVKLVATNASANIYPCASGYVCGVVITGTTTYTSNDLIVLRDGITVTVDQTITASNIYLSRDTTLAWDTSPAASYTLTTAKLWMGTNSYFQVGTPTNRIPYAQQAILSIAAINCPLVWGGDCPWKFEVYGELPTAFKTTLAADAAATQRDIVTTDDMSAVWSPSDLLLINAAGYAIGTKTVSSIAGTTITVDSNLANVVHAGYAVLNQTRWRQCGVSISSALTIANTSGNLTSFKLSGVYHGTSALGAFFFYSVFDTCITAASRALIQPVLVEYVTGAAAVTIRSGESIVDNALAIAMHSGSIVRHIYTFSISICTLTILSLTNYTIDNIFISGYLNAFSVSMIGGLVSDCELIVNEWAGYEYAYYSILANCVSTEFANIKASCANVAIAGISQTWTNCDFNRMSGNAGAVYFYSSSVGIDFVNCRFGTKNANANTAKNAVGVFAQATFRNCLVDTAPVSTTTYPTLVDSSYYRFVNYHQTANDHRSWWKYGKIQASGDALVDATVRTSGTGKFAMRFEPVSSANNLTWDFTIPTGNIQGMTMTIACWVKIAAAAFYGGTHQKPRLTINYDNGTVVYAEATATTDWQLIAVNITPTTSYGQVTASLSGRTDATGTNAYFYIDDFAVIYPAGYSLNLGGMDNWADALPVIPPIDTILSAEQVWTVQTPTLTGVGSVGKMLVDMNAALGDVPSNSELATALAGADDAVLAAIAALENPTTATIAQAVWEYVTRTITSGGITAQQVWEYATRTLTASGDPTAAQIADAVLDEVLGTHTGFLTTLATAALVSAVKAKTDQIDATNITFTPPVIGDVITVMRWTTFESGDITGLSIPADWTKAWFTVKNRFEDMDEEAVIQIELSNPAAGTDGMHILMGETAADQTDGSQVLDQAAGTAAIVLADEATGALLERSGELWDIKVLVSGDSTSQQVAKGTMNIYSAVTRTV